MTKQNEKLANEYNTFMDSIQDQLSQSKTVNPSNMNLNLSSPKKGSSARATNKNKYRNEILTTFNKAELINKITYLVKNNNEMSKKLLETSNKNNEYKTKMNKILNENKDLKNKMTFNDQSMSEQLTELQNSKETELSRQKQMLYEKIKSLTNLLEESNKLIKSYEIEVTQLKNKNSKLEYNLKMLTDSHSELEKIINNNSSGLKSELEIKEHNNNELLKELELKDLHIKSLEKLLIKQNPLENNNKTLLSSNSNNNNIKSRSKNEDINMTFSNNFIKDNNETNMSFEKDDEREKQLNKLVNTLTIGYDDNFNSNTNQKDNLIQPQAYFSNNFESKYDKEMNEELRNLAKQTNVNNYNNCNNKVVTTNTSIQTGRSNGSKKAGKIYISKK
jgi:hypothetical protein